MGRTSSSSSSTTSNNYQKIRGFKEVLCIAFGFFVRWIILFRRRQSDHGHQQQQQQLTTMINERKKYPKLEFLFFMGLEGTGHHLITRVIEQSPIFHKIVDMNIHTLLTSQLQESLWNSHTQKGLWNAHCYDPAAHPPPPSASLSKQQLLSRDFVDVATKRRHVLSIMKKIRKRILTSPLSWFSGPSSGLSFSSSSESQSQGEEQRGKIVIPLNALDTRYAKSYGMVSYPSFVGPCRPLAYPNLDLLYDICSQMNAEENEESGGQNDDGDQNIECNVVYVSRDPRLIVRSTIRRKFFKSTNVLPAIHMYRSHLNMIASQLIAYPHRVKGCYDLLSHDPNEQSTWQDSLQVLLGWGPTNRTGYQQVIRSIYKPKNRTASASTDSPILQQNIKMDDFLIPTQYQPYVDSLMRANDHVRELCQQALYVSRR